MMINSTAWRGTRPIHSHRTNPIPMHELQAQPLQAPIACMLSCSSSVQIHTSTSHYQVGSKQQDNLGWRPLQYKQSRSDCYRVLSTGNSGSSGTEQQNSSQTSSIPGEQPDKDDNDGNGTDGGDGGASHRKETTSGDGGEPWRRYPPWLKVWMWVIALAYLVARTRWRADREAKKRELEKETATQEAQNQAWDRFVEDYRKGSASKQGPPRRSGTS